MDILALFSDIDDFCLLFEPAWKRHLLASGACRRRKPDSLSLSEVMTILVLFHLSGYRNFKAFYTEQVMKQLAGAACVRAGGEYYLRGRCFNVKQGPRRCFSANHPRHPSHIAAMIRTLPKFS